MLKKDAIAIAHTLGNPSKMPGKSYGIPAAECKTGSKLRKVPGSVCSKCYACKGHYSYSTVSTAQYKRLNAIDNPQWVSAMVHLIKNESWFRWHDSGDIQSIDHLAKILMVAALTPNTNHWLPTKEKKMITDYLNNGGTIPANVTIRVSGAMIDGKAPNVPNGICTSTVHKNNEAIGQSCIAPDQGGECKDCRACWDRNIKNVSYHVH
jgi:hypothetical protein